MAGRSVERCPRNETRQPLLLRLAGRARGEAILHQKYLLARRDAFAEPDADGVTGQRKA
jgi:hypothetical protein